MSIRRETPAAQDHPQRRGEKSVLKPVFGAMIRAAERGRANRVNALERRQLHAFRQELGREFEAPNGLAANASAPARQAKLSTTSWT